MNFEMSNALEKYDKETMLAVFAHIIYNKELKEKIRKYIMKGEGSANTLKQNISTMSEQGLSAEQIAMYLKLEVNL